MRPPRKETEVAKVAILGGSGMLGGMIVEYFAAKTSHEIIATVRSDASLAAWRKALPRVKWQLFAPKGTEAELSLGAVGECEWIINAIGVIKPLIKDDNAEQIERAIRINSLFPYRLGEAAACTGAKVLQIATDCVYSGTVGSYTESALHDPTDVYGKTKSLGECRLPAVSHLRCSIIGPEFGRKLSLLEWFLGQARGAKLNGFRNHLWNGVTTLQYARLCAGVVDKRLELPHLLHVVPGDRLTKAEMLGAFARAYGRSDLDIQVTDAAVAVDRTLATNQVDLNRAVWQAAGYTEAPGVAQMVEETARFPLAFRAGSVG